MRILIVDDEPVNRLVLTRKLSQWGHEVVQACDGAEA
jgi:two-component system, NtrC family, sensor kinase